MKEPIHPYIIRADFDESTEDFGDRRWVAGAGVELGNKLEPVKSRFLDKFRSYDSLYSLNCFFTFFVCSPEFKQNPEEIYKKYANIMLVQNEYNPIEAETKLEELVNKIGKVSLDAFDENIHKFLESEEWDYLNTYPGDNESK